VYSVSDGHQRLNRPAQVLLLDQQVVVGVEGREGEQADARPGQRGNQARQDADLGEIQDPGNPEGSPVPLGPDVLRDVHLPAEDGQLLPGAGEG